MNSRWRFICEGLKQAGLVFVALLLLGGLGWLGTFGNSTHEVLAVLGWLTFAFAASMVIGPVPTLLTLFDITDKQLLVLSCVLIVPYWACLGAIAGFLQRGIEMPDSEQAQMASLKQKRKYARWTIEAMALAIAVIFFLGGPIAGPGPSNRRSFRIEIHSNLRQIDVAKNQLALEKKLPSDYVPTKAELAEYLGSTNFFNRPAGPIRYILNPINKPPFAVLDSDWRFPRRGWREGYTITNGTVFRLP